MKAELAPILESESGRFVEASHATVSKKWEISKKWEKVGLFCGANFQIIFENRQILDTQAKLESKIERCFD